MSVPARSEIEYPEEEWTVPSSEWLKRSIVSQISNAPILVEMSSEPVHVVSQAASGATRIFWGGQRALPPVIEWSSIGHRMDEYATRIEDLRRMGDADGIELRQLSLFDFACFIRDGQPVPKASLVLTDSGNVRAIWKGAGGRQIGIQFRGGGRGSYVLLEPGPPSQEGLGPYGELALDELKELVLGI